MRLVQKRDIFFTLPINFKDLVSHAVILTKFIDNESVLSWAPRNSYYGNSKESLVPVVASVQASLTCECSPRSLSTR